MASNQLRDIPEGKRARVAGMVVTRQRPATAKGFLFLLIEDEYGQVNAVVSPALYQQYRTVVRGETLIWLEGSVQQRGSLNLIVTEIGSLTELLNEQYAGDEDPTNGFLRELRQAAPPAHEWR